MYTPERYSLSKEVNPILKKICLSTNYSGCVSNTTYNFPDSKGGNECMRISIC